MKKKKSFKILALSISAIMFMVLAVPGFASAASADDDPAVDFFPTINSASIDFPITLNVEAKEVGTGDTGFFTSENVSDKTSSVSIVLPVVICIIASVLAYIVLRQAKTFKQKSSESLELSSANIPRVLLMVKNPALLLAVCFGFGCAIPTFFLQANVSKADAEKVTDLDYETTDFQTYVANKVNPYGIEIDYEYNHTLKDNKTDEELVEEAEMVETEIEPKSERKIEENGEFVVGSVDVSFTTYNPNGFFADYGMKSGVKCNASDKKESLENCYEKTNLVNGENKIPSITKAMPKAEFEKLGTAAWGWSDDGKTYYPLYWPSSRGESTYDKSQTIYFAIKLTSNTPAGAYQSADNFQVYAENNKLTNDMFGQASITYKNGEQIISPRETQWPLFLRTRPGQLIITETVPGNDGKCEKFIGWSEKTQADYNTASDKNSIKLYHAGEKFAVSSEKMTPSTETNNYTVAILNAIWEETTEGCNEYNVQVDQSFEMIGVVGREIKEGEDVVDIIPEYATENGEYKYAKYCPESKPDCLSTFIDTSGHEKNISKLYTSLAVGSQKQTTNDTETFDLLTDIHVPKLKGYKFLGWELWELSGTGVEMTEEYIYKDGEFYVKEGETENKKNTITVNKKGERTTVFLTAKWELNKPIIKVKFIGQDGETVMKTWSSDDTEDEKKARHNGENIEGWVKNNSGMEEISVPTIYDFGGFEDLTNEVCLEGEDEEKNCTWNPDGTRKSIDVSDLDKEDLGDENRAVFESLVYLNIND